ncbi:MAG: BTAD domain-containing putative transcriptional regulator, partial [Gammaproteobacteria bacterium]
VCKQALAEPTYKFHPLFRQFLLHQLKEVLPPKECRALTIKAGQVLEKNGFISPAIEIYISSAEWGSAVRLIEAGAMEKFRQGRMQSLAGMINRLPPEVIEEKSWLVFWLATCRMFAEPEEASTDFIRAFERFETEESILGALAAWSGIINSMMMQWADISQIDKWITRGELLLSNNRTAALGSIGSRTTAAMCFALYLCRPHSPELIDYTNKTHSIISKSEDMTFKLMATNLLVTFNSWKGELTRSEQLLSELRPLVENKNCPDAQRVMWAAAEAWHRLTTGEVQQCADLCRESLELAISSGVHLFAEKFHSMLSQACLLLGDPDGAKVELDLYEQLVPPKANLMHYHVNFLAAWRYWLTGDVATARVRLNIASDYLHKGGAVTLSLAKTKLAEAILFTEEGNKTEALRCLDETQRIATVTNSAWLQYRILLLEAEWAAAENRVKPRNRALKEALAIARRHKLVHTDWWRGETMSELLQAALDCEIETDYVRHIITTAGLTPGPAARLSPAWPWPVVIRQLGGFEFKLFGESANKKINNRPKLLELLQLLAAHDERGLSTGRLLDTMWPNADGDDARNALKSTVHRLRKVLGSQDTVLLEEGRVRLNSAYCWSDVQAFRMLARTHHQDEKRLQSFRSALELYEGDLLPDDDAAAVISLRKELRALEHNIVMELGQRYEQRHRWGKAMNIYRRGFEVNRLDEQVCRHLMSCYRHLGQEGNALAVYERCRDELQEQHAQALSAKTQSLAKDIFHSPRYSAGDQNRQA